jgi:hypothetical protein
MGRDVGRQNHPTWRSSLLSCGPAGPWRTPDRRPRPRGITMQAISDKGRRDAPVLVSASCAGRRRRSISDNRRPRTSPRRFQMGKCARAIAGVTDTADVGAGYADAVENCRKVTSAFGSAMNGRASWEHGCSLCDTLTRIAEGHPISRIDEMMPWRFAVRPLDQHQNEEHPSHQRRV